MNLASVTNAIILMLIVTNVSCGGAKKEETLDSSVSPIIEPTPTPSEPTPFCSDKTSLVSYSALGAGTLEDPYLICTASQLNDIGLNQIGWDKHFKLMGDIDLSGVTYNPIGIYTSSPSVDTPFSGVFDGNNLTISNLSLTVNDINSSAGMFMKISGGEVKNLTLSNVNVVGTNQGTGAIAGIITSSAVTNVSISGSVSGNNYVGGVAGVNLTTAGSQSIISDSSSAVNIIATGNSSGGIVGLSNGSNNTALIQRCLSSGTITGFDNVGGLVGYIFGQSTNVARSEVVDSYATGEVIINGSIGGGVVGGVLWGKVTNSYSKDWCLALVRKRVD